MKQLLLSVAVLFLLITGQKSVQATHFAGSDLTYTCLGGTSYLITLTFYRDCSGVTVSNTATINFSCSSNSMFNFSANLPQIAGTGQEITPGCSAVPTRCSGTQYSNWGIQEYVYQGTVTLPPCNMWTMSYASGSRNPVTTVPNNTANNWYVEAKLNNLQAPCNSAPAFTNKPIAVFCNGQSSCFNHGALDPNGDSLAYSFYSPTTNDANTTVSYAFGYSASNFLTSSTPITLDPISGDICFTPTMNLTTITGIRVKEYRRINNVMTLVGVVNRDMQMMVATCVNNIPRLSGIDTTHTGVWNYNPNDSIYLMNICLGDTVDFAINGYDQDTYNPSVLGRPDIFYLDWNHGIPLGSFSVHNNGTDSAWAGFYWVPKPTDVSTIPKCFTVDIHDEACPYFGSQTFSYCIIVRGMEVAIGSDTLLCTGESLTVNAVADTSTVNYIWRWDNQTMGIPTSQTFYNINTTSITPGNHVLSIETNDGATTTQCPGRDYINVEVVYQPNIHGTLQDSAFCQGGSVTMDAGPGTSYTWFHIPSLSLAGSTQQVTLNANSGLYYVYVDGGVNTRCNDVDTFQIEIIPNPVLHSDTCLWLANSPYTLTGGNLPAGYEYLWTPGGYTSETINVNTSGNYSVAFSHSTVSPSVKCTDDVVVNVIDEPNAILSQMVDALNEQPSEEPKQGDRTGENSICSHQKLMISGLMAPAGHLYNYIWYKDGQQVSTNSFYVLKETSEGIYNMQLNIGGGCLADIDIEVEFCDVIPPNVITPNNDGKNEVFFIEGLENFPGSTILIFNRWGGKVYESTDYKNDWNGEQFSDGVYYWTLLLADGLETKLQGTLTILRK